jgi:anti-sigma-K factor RskA
VAPRPRRARAGGLRLRWAAGAAALAIGGVVVGATVLGSGGTDTRTLSAQVRGGAADSAQLEVAGGRAELVVRNLAPPRPGHVYQAWVQHGSDAPRPAGTRFVVRSGRVAIPARVGSGDRVMVTEEPAGGSPAPTSAPIVVTRYA